MPNNMGTGCLVLLVVDLICILFLAYKLQRLMRTKKTCKKELRKVKLLLSKADEFLTKGERKELRDAQSHVYTRELHQQKMAELKTVRRKVRKLLARTSVLLKEIKAEQSRMELKLASREMQRRIQVFDEHH